jgi:hypothetical protein
LRVGHERLEADGGVGYCLAQQKLLSGWFAQTKQVLLQVREPWAAIGSMLTHADPLRKAISAEMPGRPWSRLEHAHWDDVGLWCAQYWLWWNQRCRALSFDFYRVEDLDTPGSRGRLLLESVIGGTLPAATKTNTQKHTRVTRESFRDWPQLVTEIEEQARLFGYHAGQVD